MRTLMELVADLDRKAGSGFRDPPMTPRGEGEGPRGGVYWMRDEQRIPISPIANEIVFPSGQTVMLNPGPFKLTSEQIMQELRLHGNGPYSPAEEYQTYLNGTDHDLSHVALLWKSSRIVYAMMLKEGWVWVKYRPPEAIYFVMAPSVVKQQMAAAAEQFPLMQIDRIMITEITNFNNLSDRYPMLTKNKTLVFRKEDFQGFAGPFGAMLGWTKGGEAPANNYLYFLTRLPFQGLSAEVKNVKTEEGYRRRWAIPFFATPPKPEADRVVARVLGMSVFNNMESNKNWLRGQTPVNRNGITTMYSDRWFSIRHDVEVHENGTWHPV